MVTFITLYYVTISDDTVPALSALCQRRYERRSATRVLVGARSAGAT
jgi:hypothetical protein